MMTPGGNVHTMTVMENKDGSFTTSTNNTSTPQFNSSFTSKVLIAEADYGFKSIYFEAISIHEMCNELPGKAYLQHFVILTIVAWRDQKDGEALPMHRFLELQGRERVCHEHVSLPIAHF